MAPLLSFEKTFFTTSNLRYLLLRTFDAGTSSARVGSEVFRASPGKRTAAIAHPFAHDGEGSGGLGRNHCYPKIRSGQIEENIEARRSEHGVLEKHCGAVFEPA